MQAGGDLVNLVKQYNEFKLRDKGVGLAVGLMFITDIHSLGPDAFAGTTFTDAWYWNFDEQNRALGRQVPGQDRHPAVVRARRQLLGRDAVPGGRAARPAPTTPTTWSSSSRATSSTTSSSQRQDPGRGPPGRARRVPGPGEAEGRGQGADWDYEKILKTIPAAEAFRPASEQRPAS